MKRRGFIGGLIAACCAPLAMLRPKANRVCIDEDIDPMVILKNIKFLPPRCYVHKDIWAAIEKSEADCKRVGVTDLIYGNNKVS